MAGGWLTHNASQVHLVFVFPPNPSWGPPEAPSRPQPPGVAASHTSSAATVLPASCLPHGVTASPFTVLPGPRACPSHWGHRALQRGTRGRELGVGTWGSVGWKRWAHACRGRPGSCHHVERRRGRHTRAKQEEDSRTKTWEAGTAEPFALGWVKKPLDRGPGGHAQRPRPAVCGRVGVCPEGAARGRWCRGRGDSGCRLRGLSFRVGFSAAAPATQGRPEPHAPLHTAAHIRAARAASLLGRWGEAPRGLGLSAWREAVSGNSAGPQAPARPTLRLWGWGGGGGELRPGACHVPSLSEGLPPPSLPPALPGMEEGWRFPPGSRGALGPICTSVLANAGELAQPLPPLIPRPHSKYHGIKRKAEWTF